jgi:hypothetical protein
VNSHAPLKILMGRVSLRVLICALFLTKTIKVGYYMGLTTFMVSARDVLTEPINRRPVKREYILMFYGSESCGADRYPYSEL